MYLYSQIVKNCIQLIKIQIFTLIWHLPNHEKLFIKFFFEKSTNTILFKQAVKLKVYVKIVVIKSIINSYYLSISS